MNYKRAAGEPDYTQPATFHFRRYESLNHSCGSLKNILPKPKYIIQVYGDTIASDSTETLEDLPDKLCQWHETDNY
jgi:hypothetical protein